MNDVFQEIHDDLRRQKLEQFWKENGNWIIGGAIGAVILTGALTFYRHWEDGRNLKATTALSQVIQTGDVAKIEAFAGDANKQHAMLARFLAAGAYVKKGEKDKALAVYNEIIGTSGIGSTWRDLATLHRASLQLDAGDPTALEKDLAPLAGDKSPWRHSARELQGLLAARQGDMQKAAKLMDGLAADPLAPEDLRQRALSLRAVYAADIRDNKKS